MEPGAMRSAWELYAKAWAAVSPAERQDLLRRSVAPGCVYLDPNVRCQTHAELAAVMLRFQQSIPGPTIDVASFVSHHDVALVHWRAVDSGGTTRLPGADAVAFGPNGLMAQVTGFFGVQGTIS